MELLRSDQASRVDARQVFRAARLPPLVAGLFLVAWAGAVVWFGLPPCWRQGWPAVLGFGLIGGPLVALMGGAGICFLNMFLQTGRPENWLLRQGRQGLLIKLRSYQNAHLPEPHATLLFIPRDEVLGVRARSDHYLAPGSEGQSARVNRFLEIILKDADLTELKSVLKKEAKLPAAGERFVKTRTGHQPVSVVGPGILRLAWSGSAGSIRPGLKKALAILGEHHHVEGEQRSDRDFRDLDEEELEDHLLRLVEAGDCMSATAIARQRYDMSLTEARVFVDELAGTGPRSS